MTYCKQCLAKQQKINELEEEITSLKSKLRYQERTAKEGFFGSSTPSSKVPVKPNSSTGDKRGYTIKSVTYINKGHNKKFPKWGKIGVFQVFFVHFREDIGYWVKNGGWCVNLQGLGDMDKKNASKNVKK